MDPSCFLHGGPSRVMVAISYLKKELYMRDPRVRPAPNAPSTRTVHNVPRCKRLSCQVPRAAARADTRRPVSTLIGPAASRRRNPAGATLEPTQSCSRPPRSDVAFVGTSTLPCPSGVARPRLAPPGQCDGLQHPQRRRSPRPRNGRTPCGCRVRAPPTSTLRARRCVSDALGSAPGGTQGGCERASRGTPPLSPWQTHDVTNEPALSLRSTGSNCSRKSRPYCSTQRCSPLRKMWESCHRSCLRDAKGVTCGSSAGAWGWVTIGAL